MSTIENILHFPTQERRPRVNSWRWNELEEDVLDELPHVCQIVYLRIMRKHMDYSTGIVGRTRRISYEQIKERLRYTPPPQSREKAVEYSTDQVKKLIRKLVDAGLLERLHDASKGVQPMEFRLPLASTDLDSQGHDRATVTGPRASPHPRASGDDDKATTGPRKNTPQGHPSGSGNPNPLTTFGGGASDELELQPPPAEPKPKPASKRVSYPEDFEVAWSAYPKRAGSNPKRGAFKAWSARITEGEDPSTLKAAVERYAAYITARGEYRTEFVMQGQRFFGPNGEYENEWLVPTQRQPSRPDGRKGFAQPKEQGTYTPTDMDNLPAWMRD